MVRIGIGGSVLIENPLAFQIVMLRWALEAKSEQVQIIVPRHEGPGPGVVVVFFQSLDFHRTFGYENGLVFDFCLGFVTSLFWDVILYYIIFYYIILYYVMLCYVIFVFQVPYRLQCLLGKSNQMTAVFFRVIFSNTCEGCCFCTRWIPEKTPFVPTFLMNFFRMQIGEYLLKSNFEGKVRYFCFSNCWIFVSKLAKGRQDFPFACWELRYPLPVSTFIRWFFPFS